MYEYLHCLKGVWHEIFDFKFFSMNQFPLAPEYSVGQFWIFTKIRGDIRNFVFVAGVVVTGEKLSPVLTTPMINLYIRIFPQIFVKIRNGSHGILRGQGKLIHEKKLK